MFCHRLSPVVMEALGLEKHWTSDFPLCQAGEEERVKLVHERFRRKASTAKSAVKVLWHWGIPCFVFSIVFLGGFRGGV